MMITIDALEKLGAFDPYMPPREVLAAMIPLMPKRIGDAETVAGEAIHRFEQARFSAPVGRRLQATFERERKARMQPIVRALGDLEQALKDAPPEWVHYLFQKSQIRGADLTEFVRVFDAVEFAAKDIANVRPRKQGRTKDTLTEGALAAGRYLIDQGIKRKRAAAIVEAMINAYPETSSKSKEVIEQTLRNANC